MPRFTHTGGEYVKNVYIKNTEYQIIIPGESWEHNDNRKIHNHISYWIRSMKSGKTPILKYGTFSIISKNNTQGIYTCTMCDREFKSRSGYYKHRKTHKHQGLEISQPPVQNIMTQNNNVTNQNIQINITPRNFTEENPCWLTPEIFLDAIRDVTTAIPKLIKAKHFNEKYPENHNLRLGDRRDIKKRLQIYRNKRWTIENREDITDRLMYGMYDILDEVFHYFVGDGEGEEEEEGSQEALTEEELHNQSVLVNIRRSERAGRIISRVLCKWKSLEKQLENRNPTLLEKINDRFDTILLDNELKISQLKDRITYIG